MHLFVYWVRILATFLLALWEDFGESPDLRAYCLLYKREIPEVLWDSMRRGRSDCRSPALRHKFKAVLCPCPPGRDLSLNSRSGLALYLLEAQASHHVPRPTVSQSPWDNQAGGSVSTALTPEGTSSEQHVKAGTRSGGKSGCGHECGRIIGNRCPRSKCSFSSLPGFLGLCDTPLRQCTLDGPRAQSALGGTAGALVGHPASACREPSLFCCGLTPRLCDPKQALYCSVSQSSLRRWRQ